MSKFYDHPNFVDVRLFVHEPIYGGTKYYRIKSTWYLKSNNEPWIDENMTIEKEVWDKFIEECK